MIYLNDFVSAASLTILFLVLFSTSLLNFAARDLSGWVRAGYGTLNTSVLFLFVFQTLYGTIVLAILSALIAVGGALNQRWHRNQNCNCIGEFSSRLQPIISPLRSLMLGLSIIVLGYSIYIPSTPINSAATVGSKTGMCVLLASLILIVNKFFSPRPRGRSIDSASVVAAEKTSWNKLYVFATSGEPRYPLSQVIEKNDGALLVFESENCSVCKELVTKIRSILPNLRDKGSVYLVVKTPTTNTSLLDTCLDETGQLLANFRLRNFPSALYVRSGSGSLIAEKLEGAPAILGKLIEMGNGPRLEKT